jgi:hypothetical protein
MWAYLDQKRSITDWLRLIGSPVFDADLQLYILHGLSIKYDSLIVSLNVKSDTVLFNELAGLLLTHEQRIQEHALINATTFFVPIPASIVSHNEIPQDNLVTPHFFLSTLFQLMMLSSANFTFFLHQRENLDVLDHQNKGSTGFTNSSNKLTCQLCSKKGHTADRCYKCFDSTYKPPPRPPPRIRPPPPQALFVQPNSAPFWCFITCCSWSKLLRILYAICWSRSAPSWRWKMFDYLSYWFSLLSY